MALITTLGHLVSWKSPFEISSITSFILLYSFKKPQCYKMATQGVKARQKKIHVLLLNSLIIIIIVIMIIIIINTLHTLIMTIKIPESVLSSLCISDLFQYVSWHGPNGL